MYTTNTEIWRSAVGFSNYSVSSFGKVRSHGRVITRSDGWKYTVKSKLMTPARNGKGYLTVHLTEGTESRTAYVHDLVARAFYGEKPEGAVVRHLDDVKSNAALSNLAYGTRSQNCHDAVRNGTHAKASKTHCVRGHEYTSENTIRYPTNPRTRICKTCRRTSNRRSRAGRSLAPTPSTGRSLLRSND